MADQHPTEQDYVMLSHRRKFPRDRVKIAKSAPAWKAYVERFREHPAIKPYAMSQKIFAAQTALAEEREARGETSKLSLGSLKGQYPEY